MILPAFPVYLVLLDVCGHASARSTAAWILTMTHLTRIYPVSHCDAGAVCHLWDDGRRGRFHYDGRMVLHTVPLSFRAAER